MAMPRQIKYWDEPNDFVKAGSGQLTQSGRNEIRRLFKAGKGPLSIAVRMSLPHRKVRAFLLEERLIERDEDDPRAKGLGNQWVGT